MFEFFVVVICIIGFVVLVRQQTRINYLEARAGAGGPKGPTLEQFDRLVERIGAVENRLERGSGGASFAEVHPPPMAPPPIPMMTPAPVAPPPIQAPPPLPMPPPIEVRQPAPPVPPPVPPPIPVQYVPVPPPLPPPLPHPTAAVPPPLPPRPVPAAVAAGPTLSARLRNWLGDEEWETLVGGSIINKLGAVILVIGIALFLGYSFGHIGPLGRAAACLLVSGALLGTGVYTEKRTGFQVFARGFIGAGWAALYATAYAIYGVPQAAIIHDPLLGSVGVLLVACGMIAHSLKYRVQSITAIAYSAAFAAIAIMPAPPFAVILLVPLAASALYLATRMDWYAMAAFVAGATYLTCIAQAEPNGTLIGAQTILLVYWLVFESFDLLRIRNRVSNAAADFILPVNSIGFLGISFAAWSNHAPDRLWFASAWGAGLYLTSAIVRAMLRPPSTFAPSDNLLIRVRKGSFEGPTLVAVTLAAMAILGGSPRVWSSFAFALEAEILFIAGIVFRSDFLRNAGARFFVVSLLRLAITTDTDLAAGTRGALFHAFLFYGNRALRRSGVVFSTSAAALVAIVLALNLSPLNAALAWTGLGAVLLELGLFTRLREFRVQGAVLTAAGSLWAASLPIYFAPQPWQPLAACLAIVYVLALQLRFAWPTPLDRKDEQSMFQPGAAALTVLFSMILVWRLTPIEDLGIAAWVLAVLLFELGLRRLPDELRWSLPFVTTAATIAVLATHLADLDRTAPFKTAPTYAVAALCAAIAAVRLRQNKDQLAEVGTPLAYALTVLAWGASLTALWLVVPAAWLSVALLVAAAVLLEGAVFTRYTFLKWLCLATVWFSLMNSWAVDITEHPQFVLPIVAGLYGLRYRFSRLGDREITAVLTWAPLVSLIALPYMHFHELQVAPYWAGIAIVLLGWGVYQGGNIHARIQAYILLILAGVFVLGFDIEPPALAVSIPVAAVFYACYFIAKWAKVQLNEGLSVGAVLLVCAILYGQVSGGLLTVSWGLTGLTLLASGFPLRDRALRLEGLALLLVCTLKLFFYDLRNLDTPYRILSFIVLGLILMTVSWVYTRFREHIKRVL